MSDLSTNVCLLTTISAVPRVYFIGSAASPICCVSHAIVTKLLYRPSFHRCDDQSHHNAALPRCAFLLKPRKCWQRRRHCSKSGGGSMAGFWSCTVPECHTPDPLPPLSLGHYFVTCSSFWYRWETVLGTLALYLFKLLCGEVPSFKKNFPFYRWEVYNLRNLPMVT